MAIERLNTISDYEAYINQLTADMPAPQLVNGRFIVAAARPSFEHMRYMRRILYAIESYVENHQHHGDILLEFEVALDAYTIVIPDIAYATQQSARRRTKQRLYGAPDFVCEIASPSTRNIDAQEKFLAYLRAGVNEYWLVDPDAPPTQRFKLYERVVGDDEAAMPVFREIAGNDPTQSRIFPAIKLDANLL